MAGYSLITNMYVDSPYREQFVWVLRQVGMEQILFGSDYPFYTPSEAIAAVERLGLTNEKMYQVFLGTLKNFLDYRLKTIDVKNLIV